MKRFDTLPDSLPPQPRVTALLSCKTNLMALSWHMPISREPFRYAIAMRQSNYTYSLLQEYGSFALNFLSFRHYRTIDLCGRIHGDKSDKLTLSGLQTSTEDSFGNIIVDEADYAYECKIIDTYQNGDHIIFITDVTALYLGDTLHSHPTLFLGRGQYATPSALSIV